MPPNAESTMMMTLKRNSVIQFLFTIPGITGKGHTQCPTGIKEREPNVKSCLVERQAAA
jgi:hypothetical protein